MIDKRFVKILLVDDNPDFTEEVFDSVKNIQPNAFLDRNLSELKIKQAVELALLKDQSSSVQFRNRHPLWCL